MANQYLTRQEITHASLEVLENNCVIVPNMYRDLDQEFGKKGGKIGDTIYVRKPPRATVREGQAYQPQAMVDTQVPITINQQSGIDFEFSSAEQYLSLDEFQSRYLEPYMVTLGNSLDSRAAVTMMQNTANLVGTAGTTPGLSGSDAFQIYSQADQRLTEMGFPQDKAKFRKARNLVINAAMRTGWNTYSKQFFNPKDSLTKQWKTGQIDNALNMDWLVDQNTPVQTIGLLGGTGAVNGSAQTGTSIITDGWTNSVTGLLNIGDVITYAGAVGTGVYSVSPQFPHQSTGALQDFVIQQTISSDGSGNATLVHLPAIVPSGQFQNVTNSPADNALISVFHVAAAGQSALSGLTTTQGLLWTEQAHAFVCFPGEQPDGVDIASVSRSKDIGVEIRFVRTFDNVRDMWTNRTDIYWGTGPLYPEGCVRIAA
jgi:hypothetical protein